MKVVMQRVKKAAVEVDGETVGSIDHGLLLLVGIKKGDNPEDINYVADKIGSLRIFEDEADKMNLSVHDVGGEVLSVSQFTLYGDTTHGRRPSFIEAERPEQAEPLYEAFNDRLRGQGLRVATGKFGAMMDVSLINDGPVTLIVESKK
ncbi:D-tyrosyl-tRNA(Tyr) deacylase [Sporolactobacillus shoreae]|uniref:D-aminoacyl-tRNA deacylase n=1 Tax=Sporolactobacillus shoreae TaxID=1465501 RepID=A0A4Z0GQG4_9BACL|nr:D-aminoacyl-tRNA deacylase [Sporolactobacillus shoreae]TGA99514.1 D-tyrosyl-tRNA(Tyr) deacylase [Sporolactobacillus shoreae]